MAKPTGRGDGLQPLIEVKITPQFTREIGKYSPSAGNYHSPTSLFLELRAESGLISKSMMSSLRWGKLRVTQFGALCPWSKLPFRSSLCWMSFLAVPPGSVHIVFKAVHTSFTCGLRESHPLSPLSPLFTPQCPSDHCPFPVVTKNTRSRLVWQCAWTWRWEGCGRRVEGSGPARSFIIQRGGI